MRLQIALAIVAIILLGILVLGGSTDDPVVRDHTVTRTVTVPSRSPLKPGVYHEKTTEQQYIVESATPITRAQEKAGCTSRGRKLVEVEPNESPLRALITCSGGHD